MTLSRLTIVQYLVALLIRKDFPHLIITKKTNDAAMPTKAAERKQFWYPRFVNHGVILQTVSQLCSSSSMWAEIVLPI